MPPPLQIDGVTKSFAGRPALAGVSLELRDGEVLGLLGPNGAGKSTALAAIAGAVMPSTGRIVIGGVDLAADPLAA
ncbi:MAG TPA: ATP-binding cassette domain-containing protein, partial [Thermoanaerobaculia bacterium]|nr:ATP-binding cassette domain-containing protein [Thermoanaerobaculia bacterium]